jgi:hypothetical protein
MNKMQFLFLPQIRRAGCDEIFTTSALALAAVFISSVLSQIPRQPVRKSHSFLAAIFHRHIYGK